MQRLETRALTSPDGTRIAYYATGTGPLILLANGLGGTHDAWRYQTAFFATRYRVVTWDYRGTHGSGRPSRPDAVRVEDHVADALAVLDAEGGAPAIVFGWSVGVQVAFELYRRAPERVRGIVAVNGTAGRPWMEAFGTRGLPRALPVLLRGLRAVSGVTADLARRMATWPEAVTWMRRLGLAGSTLDDEKFLELCRAFATLDMDLYLRTLACAGEHDARDVLPTVEPPVLVVAGEHDRFTPRAAAEALARRVPRGELMVIAGGTHYVAMEYPDLVNLRIDKFLRERGLGALRGAA